MNSGNRSPLLAVPAAVLLLLSLVPGSALAMQQAPAETVAIQDVIDQANQEQTQALASGDPTVMSDTATAAYYRLLVQANQNLMSQGATSIQLLQITWGSVSVDPTGTSATATTVETWLTTFSDGTTQEATDSNLYSLVNQGGQWLIASDMQSPASTPATMPAPAPTPVPRGQNTSHNWAGYAATSDTYTGVTGTWTVPQPNASGVSGVGATWVGIGGVTSQDLIQAGTQDATGGQGQAQFQAWIEMLPQVSQQVPLAVAPGDSVTVLIEEQGAGSGQWQISMTNNTSGQNFNTSVSYTSSESSAEWIEEAPSSGRGTILPLDNFNTVSFTDSSAEDGNSQSISLTEAGAQPITLVNSANQALAVPSPIGADGSSFSVTRTSAR